MLFLDGLENFKELSSLNRKNLSDGEKLIDKKSNSQYIEPFLLLNIIEYSKQGILLMNEDGQPIYANNEAMKIMNKMVQRQFRKILIPDEIHHIYRTLAESRHFSPRQNWLIESKIAIDYSTSFDIKARWIKLELMPQSCMLVTMQEQNEFIKDVVSDEAEQYGLTPREKEVWMLHQTHYTYKEIAAELDITPNTVKKHMKNILAKQHMVLIPKTRE